MKLRLLFFLLFYSSIYSQSTIKKYPDPPSESNIEMHNNDYSVRVRTIGGLWQDLYEYKTYVNSGESRLTFEESSFVAFDFNGTIQIEVTCNWTLLNEALIRPQSKNITHSKNGNKIYFNIDNPSKTSIEINGDRHRNLHVFANEIDPGPPANVTTIFEAGSIYTFPDNRYRPNNNEVIYIEGGAIIRGEILIVEKSNVKILGRGIIDQTSYRKRYAKTTNFEPPYENLRGVSIRRSSNIEIEGIIINDAQAFAIETVNSNFLNFDNLKIFTRVLWGDGIDMVASNNVNINDCFIRTSDDCIAIYPTRIRCWGYIEGSTTNINVTNSSLYADAAHPIEIGWHGNRRLNNGNIIYNVNFNNIDILEHDEYNKDYQGAISINCSDENRCIDFQFNNIRVEDFTNGRLLNIKVEPAGFADAVTNGDKIRNIAFNNLSYNGGGENPSIIKGLNCERHVDGIHFQDFKVNGQIIRDTVNYTFDTINYVYNITFQEANNFSTNVTTGVYRIMNVKTGKYLHNSTELGDDGISNHTLSYPYRDYDRQKWVVTNFDNGYYDITNLQDGYNLNNSDEIYRINCKGRYSYSSEKNESIRQKWKIVENNGNYNIINAYSRAYLHNSVEPYVNNPEGDYIVTSGKNQLSSQNWKLIRVLDTSFQKSSSTNENDENIIITPNPSRSYISINNLNDYKYKTLKIVDIFGRTVMIKRINKSNSFYIGNINNGIYFVYIENKDKSFYVGQLVKN